MTIEALETSEQALRRAVAEGRYPDVQRLSVEYCDCALGCLAGLPTGDPRIPRIGAQVKEVLAWAHLVLVTSRSRITAPLACLPLVSRYLATPQAPPRTRFEA
jgi:hypothetical protein